MALENYIIETCPARVARRYAGLKRAAAQADYGDLEDFVVVDVEATGLSFAHDELIQIAAARMSAGSIQDWYVTFVNPGKPIPEDIVRLTGIRDDDVADAPGPEEAVARLVDFVGVSDVVAHNAPYDRTMVTKHEAAAALRDNVWIDSLDLTRIALPKLKSHRLIDLVHAFDAPISTHRADADVEALCAVYRILLAAVDAMPDDVVAAIAAMCDVDLWPTVRVFKHFAKSDATPVNLVAMRTQTTQRSSRSPRADAEDIAADPARSLRFPGKDVVAAAFAEGGLVGRMYKDFEPREEQVQMACAVAEAFADSRNLAVEAGTGVGKSMAYLVPAAMLAKENGITVGVATKTNALLDQLVSHELPLLDAAMRAEGGDEGRGGLNFASLKGMSHYPCLYRVRRLLAAGPRMRAVNEGERFQAAAMATLLSFIEQSDYEDMDSLKMDYRVLPRYEVTTTSNDCLRRKCPFFGRGCFVHGARRRAEQADVVVTNQTMLFCDVSAEGGLLPPVRYWVVDEAHGAEAEARRAFSFRIEADAIGRIATRVSSEEPSRNVFLRAERQAAGKALISEQAARAALGDDAFDEAAGAGNAAGDVLLFALCAKGRAAGKAFAQAADEFCSRIHDLLYFEPQKGSKGYDRVDLWVNDAIRGSEPFRTLASCGRVLCDATERLVRACQELVGFLDQVEGAGAVQREVASCALSGKDLIAACDLILFEGPATFAYSAHLVKKGNGGERLEAQMLSVGDRMNETLYATTHSVVFTSATIAVANTFDAFARALGLGAGEYSQARFLQLDSSYDFDRNMTIYVARDMPEPNEPAYLDELCRLLVGVHRAKAGATLSLFTNRKEMEKSYAVVREALRPDGLYVVCQKWGTSVKGLRDSFLADEHLSLFALKSFWEGFDAPGATLKAVVIPKLPFGRPTDPLSCERQESDRQAWSHYVLPAAVLETKQAAGRLIRSSTDTGDLILADRRLVSKRYGKVFLDSMPSHTVKVLTIDEIVAELASARAESGGAE